MTAQSFVAPGKLVLVGEYAVLDGAPAVVAAVDHGVRCTVWPSERRAVQTPGDGRFATAALEAAEAPPARYHFEDHRPLGLSMKPGLGGSAAAVVVATLAARVLLDAPPSRAELMERSLRTHRAVQGSGSGIDVAASVHGGLLRYQGGSARRLPPVRPVVIWSGAPARTGPRVELYLAWSPRGAFTRRSAEITEAFAHDPIGALREGRRLLESMAEGARIPYRTAAHDRIAVLAERFDGAAKPSGAGGGDCAVALFPDPEAEAAFGQAATQEGFVVIPTGIDALGARQEP